MTFYDEWLKKKNTEEEKIYIEDFLNESPDSVIVLKKGNISELGVALSVIQSVPMRGYCNVIDTMNHTIKVSTGQIPQYSSFEAAVCRLPEILEFAPEGLSFKEIGYQLINSPTDLARIKYGENHAKLASMMDLVNINSRPSNVKNTVLGRYLISFTIKEKMEILRRLLLRNYIIRKMIHDSSYGKVLYKGIVNDLSEATAIRRRNNVKGLLIKVLQDTENENRLQLIDWRVSDKEFGKRGE